MLVKGIALTIGVAIGFVSWVLVRKPSGLLAMSFHVFQNHIDELSNFVLINKVRPNE